MNKNQKKALLASAISLLVITIMCYSIWAGNYKYYGTPEQAVCVYEQQRNGIEFLTVLKDKGIGEAFYFIGEDFKSIKIEEKNNKWRVITNEPIGNLFQMKIVNDYMISWGKYKDKFYLGITGNKSNSKKNELQDTLDSSFLFYQANAEKMVYSNWFLVLDEEPENYAIIINGEKVQLTE